MTCDLVDFEDQELMQSYKDNTIQSAFGQEEKPPEIGRVWFNFVVDNVAKLFYLDNVRWCPHLDTKWISLGFLDQKNLTYATH